VTLPSGAPDPIDPTRPEYIQPGYPPSEHPESDYTQPVYTQPGGYPPPGYAPPGYAPPGYPPPGFGPAAGAYPGQYGVDAYGRPLSDKSKVVAGVLQILLGGLGVGRFYMGDNRTAVWQIVVTVVTCGLGHIWGIIDGIMILVNGGVDAQGRVLRD
jgi:TM2 domain-containing membrane protein YozV